MTCHVRINRSRIELRRECRQKHHAEAEPLLKRALVLQEQNLGRDHIDSAVIVDELALVCAERAKYSEAESLYLRSIAIQEHETGGENLDLAATADRYASLLARMRRFDDAKHWHARAFAIREKVASDAAARKAGCGACLDDAPCGGMSAEWGARTGNPCESRRQNPDPN